MAWEGKSDHVTLPIADEIASTHMSRSSYASLPVLAK
eukprot:CAMPEP_0115341700 /NCGR_PEP_ID=MMETSP0270-20121206/91818_1 /TAXON_ID=71861 /ORGANISM="Scrippsiella trochoidea, Strain CCMP3099" /LENGTH=36 /DNA_ID= /DNA_START= /DNA_END= /DNA_ORIENTATION=